MGSLHETETLSIAFDLDAAERSPIALALALTRGRGHDLLYVKGAASAHGGTIEVESNEETGTTFTLVLPRDGRHVLDGPPPPG